MNRDLRFSVEDSPNSEEVAIDLIRCCKRALKTKNGGVLYSASAYFGETPPQQFTYEEGGQMVERFIAGEREEYSSIFTY